MILQNKKKRKLLMNFLSALECQRNYSKTKDKNKSQCLLLNLNLNFNFNFHSGSGLMSLSKTINCIREVAIILANI